MTNARHVHAWNWLSHISVPCFCAVVASQTNSPIKFGSSFRSWENTLNFKQSLVTDTQARRIITVSNIDQVIFFLIMLTPCFFPATIQLAKCNVLMTRDTIDLEATLQQNALFDPGLWHETCVFLSLVQSIGYKKKGIKAFVYHSHSWYRFRGHQNWCEPIRHCCCLPIWHLLFDQQRHERPRICETWFHDMNQ